MKEERLWILLSRRLAGEMSTADLKELDRLLETGAQDPEIWELLNNPDLEDAVEESALDAAGVYWAKQQELIEAPSGVPLRRLRRGWIQWVAAACVSGLILFGLWKGLPLASLLNTPQEANYVEIFAGPQEKKKLTLPDGSQVILNENSRFRYNKSMSLRSDRFASLSGEAYFEITTNPDAPFVIETSQMEIRVLGTRFNVRANEDDSVAETTLFHGKIEVTLAGEEQDARRVLLKPEEKLTVKNKRFRIASLQTQPDTAWSQTTHYTISDIAKPAGENIYKENAWATSKVIFDDDPLTRVAEFLEKKYKVQVEIKDPGLLKETRIRGIFRDDSLVNILEALKFTSGFRYTLADSVVTIY